MKYNLIKKIRDRAFSWKEDKRQTYEDLSKIYRIIGLEKIMAGLEKKMGKLKFKERVEIESVYLFGTGLEGAALYCALTNKPADAFYYAAMGGISYTLCLLHHRKIGSKA